MTDIVSINSKEFIQLYRRLYSFLRETWDRERIDSLKKLRLRYLTHGVVYSKHDNTIQLHPSNESGVTIDEKSVEEVNRLVHDMRTAAIVIEEIGLKHPTVCASLLYWPVWKHNEPISEIKKLFGDE